jgi:hypothetical protein
MRPAIGNGLHGPVIQHHPKADQYTRLPCALLRVDFTPASGHTCRTEEAQAVYSPVLELCTHGEPGFSVALLPMCFPMRFSGKQIRLKFLISPAYLDG